MNGIVWRKLNFKPNLDKKIYLNLQRVHNFCWHGVDDENKTRYVANKNIFEMLNCAPDQLYYNVDEVRTSDDALIRIKLMIFYELKDIELMVYIFPFF